jgi:hypothetical protein
VEKHQTNDKELAIALGLIYASDDRVSKLNDLDGDTDDAFEEEIERAEQTNSFYPWNMNERSYIQLTSAILNGDSTESEDYLMASYDGLTDIVPYIGDAADAEGVPFAHEVADAVHVTLSCAHGYLNNLYLESKDKKLAERQTARLQFENGKGAAQLSDELNVRFLEFPTEPIRRILAYSPTERASRVKSVLLFFWDHNPSGIDENPRLCDDDVQLSVDPQSNELIVTTSPSKTTIPSGSPPSFLEASQSWWQSELSQVVNATSQKSEKGGQ